MSRSIWRVSCLSSRVTSSRKVVKDGVALLVLDYIGALRLFTRSWDSVYTYRQTGRVRRGTIGESR